MSDSPASHLLSLVIPVYFNQDNLPVTWPSVRDCLSKLPAWCDWELVFVEDGSKDASWERLKEIHAADPRHVRVIKLSRNFGQVSAILAGMKACRGDACVVMSADLQDPPELILEMVERWNRGEKKIVIGTRDQREDGFLARLTSRIFYRLMRRYALATMPEGGFDFFLVDRAVIDIVAATEEKNTFLQGHILWTGFTPEIIGYKRRKREIGKSRWSVGRKLKYFTDGFVTYTVAPIRLITAIGLLTSLGSFGYAALIIVLKIFWEIPIEGWAPTMVCILALSGVQLVMLGIIGEYMWRNYHETRRLPNYVVDQVLEIEERDEAEVATVSGDATKGGGG